MPADRKPVRRSSGPVSVITKGYTSNCTPCKRRKKRCDRVKPCMSCILHRCEDECYADAVDSVGSTSTAAAANDDANAIPSDADFYTTSYEHGHERIANSSIRSTVALALPSSYTCFCLIDFAKEILGETSFLPIDLLKQTALAVEKDGESGSSRMRRDDALLPCSARQLSLLFWVISFAAQSLPRKHELVHMTNFDAKKSVGLWKRVAVEVGQRKRKTNVRSEMLLDISSLTVQALWHTAYGDLNQIWQASGAAIRQGILIGIFHDHSFQENKFAFLAAHKLLVVDRWTAFDRVFPLGIVREEEASPDREYIAPIDDIERDASDPSFPLQLCLERKHIAMFEMGRKVRKSCRGRRSDLQKQREEAAVFVQYVNDHRQSGIRLIEQRLGGIRIPDKVKEVNRMPMRQSLLVAEWVARCAYMTCVCCMFFIQNDPDAHETLRRTSLWNAYEVLKVCPIFTKIARSEKVAYHPTRICYVLFSALRAIIVYWANQDVLDTQESTLMGYLQHQHLQQLEGTLSPASSGQRDNISSASQSLWKASDPDVPSPPSDSVILFDHKGIEADQARLDVSALVDSAMECLEVLQKTGSLVAERILLMVKRALQNRPLQLQQKQQDRKRDADINENFDAVHTDRVAATGTTADPTITSVPDQSRVDRHSNSDAMLAEDVLLALLSNEQGQQEKDAIISSFLQEPSDDIATQGSETFMQSSFGAYLVNGWL